MIKSDIAKSKFVCSTFLGLPKKRFETTSHEILLKIDEYWITWNMDNVGINMIGFVHS